MDRHWWLVVFLKFKRLITDEPECANRISTRQSLEIEFSWFAGKAKEQRSRLLFLLHPIAFLVFPAARGFAVPLAVGTIRQYLLISDLGAPRLIVGGGHRNSCLSSGAALANDIEFPAHTQADCLSRRVPVASPFGRPGDLERKCPDSFASERLSRTKRRIFSA